MKNLFFVVSIAGSLFLAAQSADYPLNHPAYSILDYYVINGNGPTFSKIKPYSRQVAIESLRGVDGYIADFLRSDSREWSNDSVRSKSPVWRFYRYPVDMYEAKVSGFDLHINPIVHFQFGKDSRSDQMLYENNRGIEVRATIDDKIGIYTMLSENQTLFPTYINEFRDEYGAIPQEGFWKLYNNGPASDFFRAEGYVDVGVTDHVSLQMGYGRHFIGDGQRSLILSDFGNRYPYLRIETEVWKIKYTNIFAQLVADAAHGSTGNLGNSEFPQKFMTMHHLDVNVTDNLNIGLFESVIFGEPDSLGGGVKFQYLNPVIFYRALEQQDGSPDNVIIGMDFNWHLWNRISLYGQLVVDEMVVSELFSGNGWWGNKQGYQLGAKYFNAFGVDRLMIQGELNAVRPYVYAHENFFTSHSHYNMPLTHPLGANFKEMLGKVDYQPFDKWRFQLTGVIANRGVDEDGVNYGSNVLRSYSDSRPDDYGNEWLQGEKKNLVILNSRISYHLRPNLFLDGDFMLRKQTGEEDSTIFGASVRWNFPERFYLF